jgi:uncharacterized protein YdeI (YjbR/CyaY-like superfamily)
MDQPVMSFPSKTALVEWMTENHASSDGIWIKIAKKGTGVESVAVTEALDVALCFGWIDGQRKPLDETYFLQKYTPRRARSRWSKRNVGLVEKLIEAGEMRPAGYAEIERAKADGRWDAAYDSPGTIQVPPDLQAELDARPAAAEFFKTLNSTNRYSILYRLHDAKRPETRARRLEQFVAMLERGETLY